MRLTTATTCLLASACFAGGVRITETKTTLPTYLPGGYDKNPVFYTGRVYQGAQGRVYPYPMQDVLHDECRNVDYKTVVLENDWLTTTMLPDLGGHLLSFTDKQTGYEIFYRQHVIKPALIGMLGAWISGGVEWNFPHHHRPTTFMPIDWCIEEDRRTGQKTLWLGETELRRRLKWSIGLSMAKDRAALVAENRFMNRQPYIESMLYWANVSVHCGPDYQVLFPPSCHLGFDHHKNFWTTFPMGPKRVDHQWIPSQRSKSANDVEGEIDLSWWKNFTVESRSIFAMDPDNDWLAGIDHKRNLGTVHVSNRHITVGKKFFLWGNFPEAAVWDKVLTDEDGPYLELMVGCWSDNQPDYSWIAPYETRVVKQYWYPVKGIGGVKNATIEGCVNFERKAKDLVFLGFNSTTVQKGAKVTLDARGKTIFEQTINIDPNTPWTAEVKVDEDVKDQELTARLVMANGKPIVAYTPVPTDVDQKLPSKVANPKPPAEYTSAEELYLTGLRLEQFHNGLIDPVPYYEEALKRDPGYSAANLALGTLRARECKYAEAEKYLRAACDRVTRNYTRAKDAEPEYMLALVCREQGKLKEAEDLFWRAAWRKTVGCEAQTELARIACLKGDWLEALDRIDDAISLGSRNAKLHVIRAYVTRKLNRGNPDMIACARSLCLAQGCDPLDYWGVLERVFFEDDGTDAVKEAGTNRGLKAQQLLEGVYDYLGIGAYDEVLELVKQAKELQAAEKPAVTTKEQCDSYKTPLFDYVAGYVHQLRGETDAAKEAYKTAAAMSIDYCFPSRHEEFAILTAAAELCPELANTWYLLGNLRYWLEQRAEGVAAWEKAVSLDASHALALRCLGFAYGRDAATREKGLDFYRRAVAADPSNVDPILGGDKLAEKLGRPSSERLAVMKEHRATVESYDPCVLRMAYLFNETGDYDEALKILTSRRFHVWEGGEGLLKPFVDALLLRGLREMEAKQYDKALADFKLSLTYPENLQAGRPGDAGTAPKSYWYIAQCHQAMGKEDERRSALRRALEGWVNPGEMNYYRVLALRALGEEKGVAENIAELEKGIETLSKPAPKVIDAYAKFGGENSPMERAADNAWIVRYLRGLRLSLDGKGSEAKALFAEVAAKKPSILWAAQMAK